MNKSNRFFIFFVIFNLFINAKTIASESTNKDKSTGEKIKNWIFDETYKDDPNFKRHRVEIETGASHVLYNRIGNNSSSGGLFDTASLGSAINFYGRFSYYFNLDKKNSFRLMVAPFYSSGGGNLDDSFRYGNQNFVPGRADYDYKFNSYRATYRRTLFENQYFTFRLGLTLKIRDASISLSQGASHYNEWNVGLVPLGHVNFEYRPVKKLSFVLEGDLAAAPQGRAIDIAVSGRYDVNDYLDLGLGYRFLEGGASNRNVHNMAFVNYYFCSLGVKI